MSSLSTAKPDKYLRKILQEGKFLNPKHQCHRPNQGNKTSKRVLIQYLAIDRQLLKIKNPNLQSNKLRPLLKLKVREPSLKKIPTKMK